MPRAPVFKVRRSLLLLILAIGFSIAAWWWSAPHPPPDPEYHGQRLSQWTAGPEFRKAEDASALKEPLSRFGPAAVPWLVYQVQQGGHRFHRNGPLPFDRAPNWVRRWIPGRWGGLRGVANEDERWFAMRGLIALGPDAAPAIPALVARLDDDSLVNAATYALNSIGAASWPAVQEILEHGSAPVRIKLLETMEPRFVGREQPPDEVAAVLARFVKACDDPNPGVRARAAYTIAQCRGFLREPDLFDPALPTLMRLLDDSDWNVRMQAILSLGIFEAKAAPAVPRLIELLDDSQGLVRNSAAMVLERADVAEKRSAPRLRAMLQDPDPLCRSTAAKTLKAFGLSADPASQ